MEQFGTELARYMLKTRESIEDLLIKFYIKYIPEGDDDNLTIHTWRPLKPMELRELSLRTGARVLGLLSDEGEIRRIDMLRAQIKDIVEAYAEAFRAKASFIPPVMCSRLDTDLDSFVSGVLAEIYEKLRICFVCGYTAKRTMETISSIFDKRATRLSGVIQWHYGHIEKYLQLKGYELAGHERFKFIVNETENTCELCLSQEDKVYTSDELAENGMFPPLHPNCGCYLAAMDGERVADGASGGAILRTGGGGTASGGGAGRRAENTKDITASLIDSFLGIIDEIPVKYYLQALVGRDFENSVLSKDERLEKLKQGIYRSIEAFENLPYTTSVMGDISLVGPMPRIASQASDMFKGGGNNNLPKYPGSDPTKVPAEGYEWRGNGAPGSKQGNWYNPNTKEWLRPDLNHPEPIKPHWDYGAPDGKTYRIFPDGTIELK